MPPRHFCVVDNPVVRTSTPSPFALLANKHLTPTWIRLTAKGELDFDKHQQVKLRHGEQEIRTSQDPFPLYPGERLNGAVQPLLVVAADTALRLRACTLSCTQH